MGSVFSIEVHYLDWADDSYYNFLFKIYFILFRLYLDYNQCIILVIHVTFSFYSCWTRLWRTLSFPSFWFRLPFRNSGELVEWGLKMTLQWRIMEQNFFPNCQDRKWAVILFILINVPGIKAGSRNCWETRIQEIAEESNFWGHVYIQEKYSELSVCYIQATKCFKLYNVMTNSGTI